MPTPYFELKDPKKLSENSGGRPLCLNGLDSRFRGNDGSRLYGVFNMTQGGFSEASKEISLIMTTTNLPVCPRLSRLKRT